jgi:hypothetical protein
MSETHLDIVERLIYGELSNYDDTVELCREAAAEIERLRKEVARRDDYHLFTLQELNNTGLKEIERLRDALSVVLNHFKQYELTKCCRRVYARGRRALEHKP